MSKSYFADIKKIDTDLPAPESWNDGKYFEMLSSVESTRARKSQGYVRSPLSRSSSFVHPGVLSPHARAVFRVQGLKLNGVGLEIEPLSDVRSEAFPGTALEIKVINALDKKSPRSPLASASSISPVPLASFSSPLSLASSQSIHSARSEGSEFFVSPRHKSLLRVETDWSRERKDDEGESRFFSDSEELEPLETPKIILAGYQTRNAAIKKFSESGKSSFFTPKDRRNIPPVLGQDASCDAASAGSLKSRVLVRRSSLTSNLPLLVQEEQASSGIHFLSTPELPKRNSLIARSVDDSNLMRSPSAPTVGASIVGRYWESSSVSHMSKPSRLESVRACVTAVIQSAKPSSDAIVVDESALIKKGEALARALAAQPNSAEYLDWLLTEYHKPEKYLKEARELLLSREVAEKRLEVMEELTVRMDQGLKFDEITTLLHWMIGTLERELQFSPDVYGTLYAGSDLNGSGERVEAIRALVKKAREDLISELRDWCALIEGRYISNAALGRFGFPVEEPVSYYKRELTTGYLEARAALEGLNQAWIFNDESPAAKVAVETEKHRKMASELAALAPSLGVKISKQDLLELHHLAISPNTTQSLVLPSRHASDDSSEAALTIIDAALAADGYQSPSSRRESLASVDLSEESTPSSVSVESRESSEITSQTQEDVSKDSSGKSLLQLAIDAGNYSAAFVIREHGGDFNYLDRDGNVPKLNMIRISRKKVEIALQAYEKNRAHMVLSQNYQELRGFLDQAEALRMGDLMKVFLVNEGAMEKDSMKTLLAHHLNIPGIDIKLSDNEFPSVNGAKEFIRAWCQDMIFLKLGVPAQGFEEASSLLKNLIGNALDNLEQPEYRDMLNTLFSMSALKSLSKKIHTDQNLAKNLREKFGAYLSTDKQAVQARKAGPQTAVRKSLDQVLEAYRSKHRFSSFKSNYRAAAKLRQGHKSLSENLPLGDLLAIFHSKSGEFSEHSFKRLLAKELNIPGFESDQIYQDQKVALRLIDSWAKNLLTTQLLGELASSDGPPGNTKELPSQRLLNLMMNKAFGYFGEFNGSSKAQEIFNSLAGLDTSDIRAGFPDNARMDQEISRLLQSQLSKRSGVKAQDVRQPVLARAFSAPRHLLGKSSDASFEILAQHINQESAAAAA